MITKDITHRIFTQNTKAQMLHSQSLMVLYWTASFPLLKRYGEGEAEQLRRITRPREDSVVVSVDAQRWTRWLD